MQYSFLLVITVLLLLTPNAASAAVNLPWSTTYNCPEWKQTDGNPNCDSLAYYGGWTTTDNKEEQITSAANYPGGGSGRGQRHWLGDGSANNSGGTKIEFTSPQSELWIRWYMRFQQDFTWSSLQQFKILYINVGTSNSVILTPMEWDRMYVQTQCTPQNYRSAQGYGWDSIIAANGALDSNGHRKSDGQWHYYEVHLKVDTNGSNGIAEWWIDGIQVMSYNNVNFCGGQWTYFVIGENHAYSSNGSSFYVDYDDIVASTTGPIGGSLPDKIAPSPTNGLW
ncbi:MAG: hypothetical protein AAB682_01775 [Patescibacteria group bacterium]